MPTSKKDLSEAAFEALLKDNVFGELNLNGAIRTEEVTVQFENNSQADTDLRNVRPGGDSVSFSGGKDKEVAPDTTSFRSSPFIRDRPVAVMIEPQATGGAPSSQEGVVNINEGF